MSQMSFGDSEYTGKKYRMRREVFLAERDKEVPRKALLVLIERRIRRRGAAGHRMRWRRCCGFT